MRILKRKQAVQLGVWDFKNSIKSQTKLVCAAKASTAVSFKSKPNLTGPPAGHEVLDFALHKARYGTKRAFDTFKLGVNRVNNS